MTVGDGFPSRTRTGTRRLDPGRDRTIAAAVLEVLAGEGYAALTMDAVAVAAGVGKATIYRRWSSKGELLASVMDIAGQEELLAPDTGDLREDLLGLMTAVVRRLDGPTGRATRSLLGAVVDEPALAEVYRRGPLTRWDAAWSTVLARAAARGEIAAEAPTTLAAETGPAVVALRWLVTGEPLDDAVVTALVDEVVLPLLRPR